MNDELERPEEIPEPGTRHTCHNCGGVYIDPQADGGRYEHRCPLSRAEDPGLPKKRWWQRRPRL